MTGSQVPPSGPESPSDGLEMPEVYDGEKFPMKHPRSDGAGLVRQLHEWFTRDLPVVKDRDRKPDDDDPMMGRRMWFGFARSQGGNHDRSKLLRRNRSDPMVGSAKIYIEDGTGHVNKDLLHFLHPHHRMHWPEFDPPLGQAALWFEEVKQNVRHRGARIVAEQLARLCGDNSEVTIPDRPLAEATGAAGLIDKDFFDRKPMEIGRKILEEKGWVRREIDGRGAGAKTTYYLEIPQDRE